MRDSGAHRHERRDVHRSLLACAAISRGGLLGMTSARFASLRVWACGPSSHVAPTGYQHARGHLSRWDCFRNAAGVAQAERGTMRPMACARSCAALRAISKRTGSADPSLHGRRSPLDTARAGQWARRFRISSVFEVGAARVAAGLRRGATAAQAQLHACFFRCSPWSTTPMLYAAAPPAVWQRAPAIFSRRTGPSPRYRAPRPHLHASVRRTLSPGASRILAAMVRPLARDQAP